MPRRQIIVLLSLALFVSLIFTSSSLAQTDFVGVNTPNPNFQTLQDITPSNYVRTIINLLLGAAGIVSLIFLLIGGIRWITAGGNKDGAENARKIVSNSLFGLAIVFSVYVIFFFLRTFFNIDLIESSIFRLGSISTRVGNISTYAPSGGGGGGYVCTGGGCPPPSASGSCGCGGPAQGQCATAGTQASTTYNGPCFVCDPGGTGLWLGPTPATSCPPITCGPCN